MHPPLKGNEMKKWSRYYTSKDHNFCCIVQSAIPMAIGIMTHNYKQSIDLTISLLFITFYVDWWKPWYKKPDQMPTTDNTCMGE